MSSAKKSTAGERVIQLKQPLQEKGELKPHRSGRWASWVKVKNPAYERRCSIGRCRFGRGRPSQAKTSHAAYTRARPSRASLLALSRLVARW